MQDLTPKVLTPKVSNQLTQTITPWAHYTYDGAGNQTRAGWLNYSYGADNRMSQSASGYNGVVYGSYVYNGNGERAIRHGLYGGGTTYYVYDEQGHLLGEYDVNGISINEYAYGPTGREARLAYWGGIHTYYNDHLGTPQVITNWSQNVLWEGDYKPFGEVAAVRRNPNGNAWQFWSNLRFPGQLWDYRSQTIYNYFRNLDPKTGRYTQHDLIGLNGGMNPFAYVGGNPISNMDPLGLRKYSSPAEAAAMSTVEAMGQIPGQYPNNPQDITNIAVITGVAAPIVGGVAGVALTWSTVGLHITSNDWGNLVLDGLGIYGQTMARVAGLSDNVAGWFGFGVSQMASVGQHDGKVSKGCNGIKNGK